MLSASCHQPNFMATRTQVRRILLQLIPLTCTRETCLLASFISSHRETHSWRPALGCCCVPQFNFLELLIKTLNLTLLSLRLASLPIPHMYCIISLLPLLKSFRFFFAYIWCKEFFWSVLDNTSRELKIHTIYKYLIRFILSKSRKLKLNYWNLDLFRETISDDNLTNSTGTK